MIDDKDLFRVGIIREIQAASPEAQRAQRMAELEQIAKYRYEKLQKYIDWANDEKREKIKAQADLEAKAARAMVAADPEKYAREFDVGSGKYSIGITPVSIGRGIPVPQWSSSCIVTWYRRMIFNIRTIFARFKGKD